MSEARTVTRTDRRRPLRVLVVCTANICRSPVAAELLAHEFDARRVSARVRSAGVAGGRLDVHADTITAAERVGVDIRRHVSTLLTADMIDGADLVLTMTRAHLRAVVAAVPEAWPRVFTVKELARRLDELDPLEVHLADDVPSILAAVSAERRPGDLVVASDLDDLADPYGRPFAAHLAMACELAARSGTIADHLAPLA